MKYENKIDIIEVDSIFLKDYFADRPIVKDSKIKDKNKLNIMRNWKVALEEYLKTRFKFIMKNMIHRKTLSANYMNKC